MENIIESEIRRTSRNLLLTNLGILIFCLLVFFSNLRYYKNFFEGPFNISKQELISIKDPSARQEYYITIKGDSIYDSGYYQIEQTLDKYSKAVKSERKVASYDLLDLDDKSLLVHSEYPEHSTTLTGYLDYKPNDLRKEFADDKFLPFMIYTSRFKASGYFGLIILIPLFLLSLWNIQNAIFRLENPAKHPIHKSLKQFGDISQIESSIINEFHNQDQYLKIPKAHLSKSWLVIPRFFKTDYIHNNSLIWLYKVHTKHSVNWIPTGSTYKIKIFLKEIKYIAISYDQNEADYFLKIIYKRNPWVHLGYSDKLNNELHSKPRLFIDVVEYRRNEMLNETKKD